MSNPSTLLHFKEYCLFICSDFTKRYSTNQVHLNGLTTKKGALFISSRLFSVNMSFYLFPKDALTKAVISFCGRLGREINSG